MRNFKQGNRPHGGNPHQRGYGGMPNSPHHLNSPPPPPPRPHRRGFGFRRNRPDMF